MTKQTTRIPALRFPEFASKSEWESKELREIFDSFSGGTPSTSDKRYYGGEIPFIRSAEIAKEKTELLLTEEGLNNSSAKLVNKGDLLVALYGANSGDVAISKINGAINQAILCMQSDYSNSFTYNFLSFKKDWIVSRYIQGGQGNLSGEIVKSIRLLFPKPQEQQKIAACLSALDALIAAHTDKLDALKEHKKGLLQKLFPQKGERLPQLRFSEFEGDGDWVETTLEQVADYQNGKAHEKDIDENGNYTVVNSKFISTEGKTVKYSEKAFCLANLGDILMVLSDVPNGKAIAKCFYVDEEDKYSVNQRICRITATECDSHFLLYIMDRNTYFLSFDDGVKQTNLRKADVLKFGFRIPTDPDEQIKIAACLSAVDDLITAQQEKIEELQQHKKGLMQGLFPKIEN